MHAIDALLLAIVASTPLLLAVEGEVMVQRSGVINLGIEGMMLTASLTAVIAAQWTNSVAAGFVGGIVGAALMGTLFGLFAVELRADQIVTGTAMNLLALGATGFIYRLLPARRPPHVDRDVVVVLAWILLPAALALLLWKTMFGLRLRACGENPEAATAAGASVRKHRWAALAIEMFLIGLAGAHLALVLSNAFAENMTAGRGFIALSIVIFGRWKLKGAVLGTAVFGVTAALQYALQAGGYGIQFHLPLMLPYVVTLLILCGLTGRVRAPEALGRS